MAILIARYLMNDATSGTGVTTLTDSSGNGHNAAITFASGMSWTTGATGTGIEYAGSGGGVIAPAGSLGTALASLTQLSVVMVATGGTTESTPGGGMFLYGDNEWFHNYAIGSWRSGENQMSSGWASNWTGANQKRDFNNLGGQIPLLYSVYVWQVNATAGVTGDARHEAWQNNVVMDPSLTDADTGTIPMGSSFGSTLRIFGNEGGVWPNSELWYFEMWDGLLTAQERTDAYNHLVTDSDSGWDAAGPGPLAFTSQPSATSITETSVTGQAIVDES